MERQHARGDDQEHPRQHIERAGVGVAVDDRHDDHERGGDHRR
jgi:hypothetical protein